MPVRFGVTDERSDENLNYHNINENNNQEQNLDHQSCLSQCSLCSELIRSSHTAGMYLLTVHVQEDPFAHRRWHIVRGNAQIRSHLASSDPGEVKVAAVMCIGWK